MAVNAYNQFVLWRDAVPITGEFYCEELNSTLSFTTDTLEYDNQSYEVFMEHGGLFHVILSDGSHWYADYFWNQEKNSFVLIPQRTNGDFKMLTPYAFRLVEQ